MNEKKKRCVLVDFKFQNNFKIPTAMSVSHKQIYLLSVEVTRTGRKKRTSHTPAYHATIIPPATSDLKLTPVIFVPKSSDGIYKSVFTSTQYQVDSSKYLKVIWCMDANW